MQQIWRAPGVKKWDNSSYSSIGFPLASMLGKVWKYRFVVVEFLANLEETSIDFELFGKDIYELKL